MFRKNYLSVLLVMTVMLVFCSSENSQTHALFDLKTPAVGPFPSNRFTVVDDGNITGIRINMPKPDCVARPSDCQDIDILNTLDGFNQLPRISVSFDGPIDPASITGRSVLFVSLGNLGHGDGGRGRVVGINRIVWDPAANVLHAEADELLEQHARFALIVTNSLRDTAGDPVEASVEFEQFRRALNRGQTHDPELKRYRKSLLEALQAAREAGIPENEVVSASVFTTQSSTALMEKIRDQIKAGTPAPADFNLGSDGSRTVFSRTAVTGITFNQQTGVSPATFSPVPLNLSLLQVVPGSVGRIAFGKYSSPDYLSHPCEYIAEVGTLSGTPTMTGVNQIYFNLFIPSGEPPPDGWPVAIFGPGSAPNKNDQPMEVASVMASHGIATISINLMGNGFGPQSTLVVDRTTGGPVTLLAGGRGVDQNGDNVYANGEGRSAAPPRSILSSRDAARQTIADFMQLVRVIQVGMDVDGNLSSDLDASRIYYFGHSLGANWGSMFIALEPDVRVGVFNSVATPYDNLRLSPTFRAGSIGVPLSTRTPSLINAPGLTAIGGVAVGAPRFNENLPLRDEPPLVNTVAGAMEIQEFLDRMKWSTQSASSLVYAPYIRKQPLASMTGKTVLIQFSKGDRIAMNPGTSALLRAGDLSDRTTYFRNDMAVFENPLVPHDPHLLIRNITLPSASIFSRAIQDQAGVFLSSNGATMMQPEPARLFEVPIAGTLPETLNFILP